MRKVLVVGIIILFVGGNTVSAFGIITSKSSKPMERDNWLYVGGSGPGNYTRIQNAIDNASNGDTVFVYDDSAPYYEHLLVNRSITLVGQNQSSTIIDGRNNSTIIHISSEQVHLQNLSIRNSGGYQNHAGILTTADSTTIINCTIYRARTGIIIEHGTNCTIMNCSLYTTGEGIYCTNTYNVVISHCQLCHNAIGLRLNTSTTCTIYDTFFHTNGFGCYFDHATDITLDHCALDDNNDNQGGAYLTTCTNVLFNNSNICHNGVGINIGDTQDIQIIHCDINLNTKLAARFEGTTINISLVGNEISHNYHYGIYTTVPLAAHNNNFYHNELYALYATMPCDATRNWWNAFLGPAITEFGLGERISRNTIHRFPWLFNPSPDAGSTWETATCFIPLRIPANTHNLSLAGNDTDYDGAPDWWELKYGYNPYHWDNHTILDEDHDGLTSLEECYTDQWGSHPFKQDIFIEIDWMETNYPGTTNKPDQTLIEQAIALFEEHNITLHIDTGAMGGGEMIPYYSLPSFVDFRDLYWVYFLHQDLNQPRKGIFHYAIITDDGKAGYTIFGWDQLDFFNIGAQQIHEKYPWYTKKHIIIHVALHELGHGLGLFGDTFGGIDNRESIKFTSWETWKYIPYRSCMNYHYTYRILGYSDGTHGPGDFDDWGHLNLSLFKNTSFTLLPSRYEHSS